MKPAPWLIDHLHLIAPSGRVLDVASGQGRNALHVASTGRAVHAVDRDADALAVLAETAAREGLSVTTAVRDLERGHPDLGDEAYDGVIVFNYLHRPLMPRIVAALRADGVLIYETFTIGQAARGHPRNPDYLLQPGELRDLVQPLRVVHWREGEVDGKLVASVVARR